MMSRHRVAAAALIASTLLVCGCYKPLNLEETPIPPNTLILEFAAPIRYTIDLKIDGETLPIKFGKRNKRLWIEGLEPGEHSFNIHSISYVFGPEFEYFKVNEQRGAYFFIQLRKYRSALPKDRSQVSIKAYRRQLRKDGVDLDAPLGDDLRAYFTNGRTAPPKSPGYKKARAEARAKEREEARANAQAKKDARKAERAKRKLEKQRKREEKKKQREQRKRQAEDEENRD